MKYPILLLFLVFAISAPWACIRIRVNSDYASASNTLQVSPFQKADIGRLQSVAQASDIRFQEIDAGQLRQIARAGKKTWVYLWGSWCTPCRKKLPLIAQLQRDNPDWHIVLVADDYNIAALQQLLFEQQIFVQSYILDYRVYGNNIHEKYRKLWEGIAPGFPFADGMPQNYIFNPDGTVHFYGAGSLPQDSMKAYFVIR